MFERQGFEASGAVVDPDVQMVGVDARLLASTQHRMAARALAYVEHCRTDLRGVLEHCRDGAAKVAESLALTELSLVLHTPEPVIAADLARTARVRDRLPSVWTAWSEGTLDQWRVTIIDETASKLTRPASVARLDRDVMRRAPVQTIAQLRAWCRRFVARVEPEAAAARHRDALGRRRVTVTPSAADEGISWLELSGDSVDLAAVDANLTRQAWLLGRDDPRSIAQRRADIAIDLLLERTTTDTSPGSGTDSSTGSSEGAGDADTAAAAAGAAADSAASADAGEGAGGRSGGRRGAGVSIAVTVPIQSLFGYTQTPGELADRSAAVPAHVIRDLATREGTLFHRLLTDPTGRVLDVTEMGRFPSTRLGTAIDLRDGTCVFPTCTAPAVRCDCDHTLEHPQGPTRGDNLGALCRRHHCTKTHTRLSVVQTSPGVFDWTTPAGQRHHRPPDPVPIDTWPPEWDSIDQVTQDAEHYDSDLYADAYPPDPLAS